MAKLTDEQAQKGMEAIKLIHELANITEEQKLIRPTKVLHEAIRRYGEEHHADVTARGGDT